MTHGLIFGRFDPPHEGQIMLARTARELVDRLTIVALGEPGGTVPLGLRVAWLKELLPQVDVVALDLPEGPPRAAGFADLLRSIVAEPIDVMFAGSSQGEATAARLGARFVELDHDQRVVPISGAEIREDPFAAWGFLPPPVKPYFAKTICLHGPESTGKSTLAPRLARHFETLYLPEYGRTYCEAFGLALTMADLLAIGRTHAAMTRATLRVCNRRLILDTDPLMTAAWAEMLFERSDPWFDSFDETADLYLLLDIDMPWVDDGTRFFGDAERRRKFFDCSRDQLERRGLPYAIVSGAPEERFERSLAAIREAGLG
ncbi:AAA family ATPase [Sphingomonas sp. AP4-R1]|uniref:AAA family ATPase n=1 Tax=Sphingomonas sp. AP4-R1 TaxID=2735134 RepID=UPI0020A50C98|nr:AAA family ATPase [Sphingomonas sp. AP4-R1]